MDHSRSGSGGILRLACHRRAATGFPAPPSVEPRRELMSEANKLLREIETLRDRLSKLSEAGLRISESLDLDSVLQEAVSSARALTGARHGVMITFDERRQLRELVTSGVSQEERQRLLDLPEGQRLYEYFREIPEPLSLRNVGGHLESLGFPADIVRYKTFLGMPMRYRGVHVGGFYLSEKEGDRAFTGEDEEILATFVSHAAAAIANARRHSEEQRVRADLEALIDTSPVGVVVLDARTGALLSINQEAKRIVGRLSTPGRPLEHLLEVLTIERADGGRVSLEEYPVARMLSESATVRAEKIVLRVPDGRNVSILINATPIIWEGGRVESVIVTLQDMSPLEELERMRAEFLGMVSHELRAPLASIMGSATAVLNESAVLDPAEMIQFFRIVNEQAGHMHSLIRDLLDVGRIEAGMLSVSPEPVTVTGLVDEARNMFLSGGGRNPVELDLPTDLPRVLADRRRIVQVLGNLLSNAATHSPESSPIRIAAKAEGVHVAVTVADEGAGVSAERLPHLFRKVARTDGGEPGRKPGVAGLGLAICKGLVEAHGGRIWVESDGPGQGTRFTFTISAFREAIDGTARGSAETSPESHGAVPARTRVLVVDDDPLALRYARDALAEAGYDPLLTGDPEEVSRLMNTSRPDLVLLDLVLPGTDGIELMAQVPALADVPVIFLSGYGRDETIARALRAGAADYIVKPFSPTELAARITAALRKWDVPQEPYRVGDLAISYEERRVSVAGRPVKLTATEYGLLRELSVNAGRVLTHDTLLRRVWKKPDALDASRVRTVVKVLRRKLGDDASNPSYILTEARVGYRMPKPDNE